MLELQEKVMDLEEDLEATNEKVSKLEELQTRHEHQDEIRAVKQDQLMANIQSLVTTIQNYQAELHEMVVQNTKDISEQEVAQAKTSTRVKILYGALVVVGGAMLTGIFEWLPQLIQLLSKGK
jgi:hypothetical protein